MRSIHHPGVGDDYYDLEFFYGNCKASVNTSMCVQIDYPRFTLHGTNGSFTLPPVIHNSGKAHQPLLPGQCEDLPGLGRRGGKGLFHQGVLAGV